MKQKIVRSGRILKSDEYDDYDWYKLWAANSSSSWTVSAGLAIHAVVQANLACGVQNLHRLLT